jgi:SAM-dependent methyltransferase
VSLTARSHAAERMDDPALAADVYAAVLAELARVNGWTRARPMTLAWLERASAGMQRFSVLDVGFGHGDMLRAVARWARRRGLEVELTGVDLNPGSAPVAAAASEGLGIRFVTGDARDTGGADFIISSLVAHHMGDAELVAFLGWMEDAARRGWFVNDLHRHGLARAGFRALAGVLGWHPIVRHDGALSVQRGFTRVEWQRLLAAAGIEGAEVRWHLPFRWGVGRVRP